MEDDKQKLRLWLRLLKVSRTIENDLRGFLRNEFNSTLPRFDMLAALSRSPENGLLMGEISSFLRVSNGNVTAVVTALLADNLISRVPEPHDKRSYRLKLTAKGVENFSLISKAHEARTIALLKPISLEESDVLMQLLGQIISKETHEKL